MGLKSFKIEKKQYKFRKSKHLAQRERKDGIFQFFLNFYNVKNIFF
jgi:hypothetical protein